MSLLELLLEGKVDEFNASRGRYTTLDFFAADLAGLSLAGVDLSGANLEKADLSGADLSNAILMQANLSGADLTGANLSHAVAVKSRWREAFLGDANLEEAEFSRSEMAGADFTGAAGAGVRMTHAKLKDAIFARARFPDAHFDQANLVEADFRGALMQRGGFQEAVLSRATLDEADFTGSDFTGARLSGASARKCVLEGCIFRQTDLTATVLEGANLDGSDLHRADLAGANLAAATLRQADLRETHMDEVDLSTTVTDGAVLALPVPGVEEEGPEEENVPLQFGDFLASRAGDRVGVLWDNEEPGEAIALRVGTCDLAGHWTGRTVALPEPADLITARALLPGPDQFRVVLFIERPAGLSCRLTEFSLDGAQRYTRSLSLEYAPAVKPNFLPHPDGFILMGLSRNGPQVQVHRFDGNMFVPLVREKVATARGFAGADEPVLVCKGGVVIPVGVDGLRKPVRTPEGFPGRCPGSAWLGDDVFLAWIEPGSHGFRWCLARSGADAAVEKVAPKHGVASLDVARFGERVLAVFTRESDDLAHPMGLWATWLPGGRPFPLEVDLEEDVEDVHFVLGSATPLVACSTLGGALLLIEVGEGGGRLVNRLR